MSYLAERVVAHSRGTETICRVATPSSGLNSRLFLNIIGAVDLISVSHSFVTCKLPPFFDYTSRLRRSDDHANFYFTVYADLCHQVEPNNAKISVQFPQYSVWTPNPLREEFYFHDG